MQQNCRKHFTQMTQDEIRLMLSRVRSRQYKFSDHAFDRMGQKRVTEQQILAMLTYCSVVEFHNNIASELRVLVRGKVQGNFVCAVVSLNKNEVVTTYWNQAGDHHKTLDRSQYNWNVPAATALQMFNC